MTLAAQSVQPVDTIRNLRPDWGPRIRLAERVEQLLGLGLLAGVAFLDDFLQDFARAVFVAHLLVRLGEIEFRLHVIPVVVFRFATGRRSFRGDVFDFRRVVQIEADVVEFDIGN